MLAAMHALHSPLIVSNGEKLVCSRFTALRPPTRLTTNLSDTAGGTSARRCPPAGSNARSSSAKAAFLPASSASLLPAGTGQARWLSGWCGAQPQCPMPFTRPRASGLLGHMGHLSHLGSLVYHARAGGAL